VDTFRQHYPPLRINEGEAVRRATRISLDYKNAAEIHALYRQAELQSSSELTNNISQAWEIWLKAYTGLTLDTSSPTNAALCPTGLICAALKSATFRYHGAPLEDHDDSGEHDDPEEHDDSEELSQNRKVQLTSRLEQVITAQHNAVQEEWTMMGTRIQTLASTPVIKSIQEIANTMSQLHRTMDQSGIPWTELSIWDTYGRMQLTMTHAQVAVHTSVALCYLNPEMTAQTLEQLGRVITVLGGLQQILAGLQQLPLEPQPAHQPPDLPPE
ncbi:MAG: hypothetical protein LBJ69_01635, partial [Holosporales bacterium]|jgi:hypothetical protein|nr:hypothetical protein [Holosporales bacterium]